MRAPPARGLLLVWQTGRAVRDVAAEGTAGNPRPTGKGTARMFRVGGHSFQGTVSATIARTRSHPGIDVGPRGAKPGTRSLVGKKALSEIRLVQKGLK